MQTRERMSGVIGAIYDCVIDPSLWTSTLELIRREVNGANALIAAHSFSSAQPLVHAYTGVDQAWLTAAFAYEPQVFELWGGEDRIKRYPLEEPIIQSQATPRSSWQSNPYYKALLEPNGLFDAVSIALARDQTMFSVVTLGRLESAGEFTMDEMETLRLLAPHLRRAVVISQLFERKTAIASTFAATLDAIAAGVVIVDEHLGIIHANAAAENGLQSGDPLSSRNGRLHLQHPTTHGVLASAVAQAARDEVALERRSIGIPTRRRDGSPAVLRVLPLRYGELRPGLAPSAVAAVFIAEAAGPPQLPADALAVLYDLTPAETRVFELIVAGRTLAEVATQLGVSLTTVKSHLGRVFEKTGCGRQAELVSIAASVTLPV